MKYVLRVVATLAVLGVLAYLLSKVFYTYVPDSRRMASDLYEAATSLRQEISKAALSQGSLQGVGRKLHPPTMLSTRYGNATVVVSDAGSIQIKSAKPEIAIDMVPLMERGVVNWQCHGSPLSDMPIACRPAN